MDAPQDVKRLEYLWTSSPLNSGEPIKERPPLLVSFLGVVQEEPRYIRTVNLQPGVFIQIVTTPTLKRGYFPRAANDFLLCEIDSREDSQEATLAFVDVDKTLEDADTWLAEASE